MSHKIVLALSILLCSASAYAQTPNCRAITDSLERLRCYEARDSEGGPSTAAPAKPATPAEDPFVTAAKARVKQQLLDPLAARFSDIKIKTVAGKKGLCGQINGRNSTGGMTGNLPFTYDGQYATIMIFNPGAGNPTSMGPDILGVTLGRRLESHDRWCK